MSKTINTRTVVQGEAKKADKAIPAPALSYDPAAVKAQAVALAAADKAFENGIEAVADGVGRLMGTNPTYAHWEAVAAAFVVEYRTARGCEEKTALNRWSVITAKMREAFGQDKPRKPTEGAAKKAAQREKAQKAIDRIIKAHKGNAAEILRAASEAKPADVAVYAKAAEHAAKVAQSESVTKAKAAEKKLREEAVRIIGAASGAMLESMVTQLRRMVVDAKAKTPVAEKV